MIVILLLGAGLGVGLWALAVWLAPPRASLGAILERATAPPVPVPIVLPHQGGWATRLGRPLVAPLQTLGLPTARQTRDLAVVGRPVPVHLAEKGVLTVAGLLAPSVLLLLLYLVGITPGIPLTTITGLLLAAVGFVLPDLRVRSEAARRRAGFRHALSAFLDLVWINLAGGSGVDSSLTNSAAIGRGWAFGQIQRALSAARMTRATPWTTLRQLGEELDISELADLSATVSLAGTEGATVRRSLAAKAAALRVHELTAAEASSNAATERMSLPIMVLFSGFLLFIGFPAISQILGGL